MRTRTPHPARTTAYFDTNSGRGFVLSYRQGWVYPSGFLPQRAGNVRDEGTTFREIYREAPILKRRATDFAGKCGVCEFNQVCGGSRSHVYAVTGDPLASDPTCAYLPPRWREAAV